MRTKSITVFQDGGRNRAEQPVGLTAHDIKYYQSNNRRVLVSKRAFDVVISLLVIIFVLSWLLPLLGILIKCNSRGPVFFIQQRVGANGKLFNCIKLRSMVVNQWANSRQADKDDWRITSLGRFLRTSFLDELPQFINVIKGDMSIVGPRPHMIKDCDDFIKVVPVYEQRAIIRPGMTGMAQVKGYKGVTKGFHDVSHRFKWDIFYIRNMSMVLDMLILYKTVFPTRYLESRNKRGNKIIVKPYILSNRMKIKVNGSVDSSTGKF